MSPAARAGRGAAWWGVNGSYRAAWGQQKPRSKSAQRNWDPGEDSAAGELGKQEVWPLLEMPLEVEEEVVGKVP